MAVISIGATLIAGFAAIASYIGGKALGNSINEIGKDIVQDYKNWENQQKKTEIPETDTPMPETPTPEIETPEIETPEIMPTEPSIKDETNTNAESASSSLDYQSIFNFMEEQQKKQWEREDAIRLETQQREDTAWQRAIEDMRKAGINPNLVNASPAESGGGITNTTGLDYTLYKGELEKALKELEIELEQSFKGEENTKDRIVNGFSTVLNLLGMFAISKIAKGGK